jgi:hypothetical protein
MVKLSRAAGLTQMMDSEDRPVIENDRLVIEKAVCGKGAGVLE